MACNVTISSVLGALPPGGTVLNGILVTGNATECSEVKVTVECGEVPMTMIVPVSSGEWKVIFVSGGACQCGKPIFVTATCTSDPDCTARAETALACKEIQSQSCNAIGNLTVNVDGCAGGEATATAVLTFTLDPPIAGCTYEWHFGDTPAIFTTTVPTITHVYATAGSFIASVLATCPSADGELCELKDKVTVVVPPCVDCATVTDLTASVSGCAGPAMATVTFNGTLMPALLGCTFFWAFGDDETVMTSEPSTSHDYALPGTYAVAVTTICAGTFCGTATIPVEVPRCCPVVTNIIANVEDNECADGMGTSATMNFSATTDPLPAAGTYTWEFDDSTPPVTNPGPNASHEYASPGSYAVQVIYTPDPAMYPGCAASAFSTGVTVPACPTPPDGGGNGGGNGEEEGWGCFTLRAIMTIAAILALVAVSLAACIPQAAPALIWMAAILGAAAAIAGFFWTIFCPKPCAWALLLAWQVAFGAGWALLYFTKCCPAFWVIGILLVGLGVTLMLVWKQRCKKSYCAVLKELALALSGVILPLLGWLVVIPALANCIGLFAGILGVLAAIITVSALNCDP